MTDEPQRYPGGRQPSGDDWPPADQPGWAQGAQPDESPRWAPDETRTQWVQAGQTPPSAEPQRAAWEQPAAAEAEQQPSTGSAWADQQDTSAPYDEVPAEQLPPDPGPYDQERDPDLAASPTPSARSLTDLGGLRVLAQVACPLLLFVGLSFDDHRTNGWHDYTAWAVFAAVCAVLQLAPLVGRRLGLTTENAWFLAAVGTAGLVGYWVIIVLPGVSSNTGFAQTLAAGFAVIGLWLSPGRRQ